MRIFGKLRETEHTLPLYLSYAVGCVCLTFVGAQNEPFALPLCYAAMLTGLSPPLTAIIFALCSLFAFSWQVSLVYCVQAGLFALFFWLYHRFGCKNKFLPLPVFLVSLGVFYLLFPLQSYAVLEFLPLWGEKVAVAALLFLCALFFSKGTYVVVYKLFKSRLAAEESLCLFVLLTAIGFGLYRAVGENAYLACALTVILLCAASCSFSTAVAVGVFCAFPAVMATGEGQAIFLFAAMAIAAAFFMKTGKFPACFAACAVYLIKFFYKEEYTADTLSILLRLACVLLPCVLFLLLPQKAIDFLKDKTVFYKESHVSRLAINRNRKAIGERLFTLSDVFLQIDCSFSKMREENRSEEEIVYLLRENILHRVCAHCKRNDDCRRERQADNISKLLYIGVAKGKVSLMDMPRPLSTLCLGQNQLLGYVNKQLSEYRRYQLEAENARVGRELLAAQSRGMCQLLKEMAMKESQPLHLGGKGEELLYTAFQKQGIICSEILLLGEGEDVCVYLTVFGNYDGNKISSVCSQALQLPLLCAEKIVLSADKFSYTLRKKPAFDASFGVACAKKQGSEECGDAHSVIRIDEKKFLAALSDGMGSGKRACELSQTTLSLLESFYRAGMPGDTVLSTVNKLLAFRAEENFVCLDVASIDLEKGVAEIVKIASPLTFIYTEGELKVLEGESFPFGMLEDLHPSTFRVPLSDGDVLVFLSDGVVDAFASNANLLDYLKKRSPHNPQTLANELLSSALRLSGGIANDDMTVLTIRLFTTP